MRTRAEADPGSGKDPHPRAPGTGAREAHTAGRGEAQTRRGKTERRDPDHEASGERERRDPEHEASGERERRGTGGNRALPADFATARGFGQFWGRTGGSPSKA